MPCLTCTHAAVRDKADQRRNEIIGTFVRAGFVNCTLSELRATFKPLTSQCPQFHSTDDKTAEARRKWIAGILKKAP